MVCPRCGFRAGSGAVACPRCRAALAPPGRRRPPGRTKTPADIAVGIVFLVLGAGLPALYATQLPHSLPPAWQAILALPAVVPIADAAGVAASQFGAAPAVLGAFSDIVRVLAGLFLLGGGMFSLARARGRGQALAAEVLMAFGLAADAAGAYILFRPAIEAAFPQGLLQALGPRWPMHVAEVAVLAAVPVLLYVKGKSQKKRKFHQSARRASGWKAMRRQAGAGSPASPSRRQDKR